mmetsp:Transcript_49673/g.153409  ORF Transcript_49673/g.153409 Transcript_49673/m.153409 type:complete len:142 (-) Transcript_49673:312-737(-)
MRQRALGPLAHRAHRREHVRHAPAVGRHGGAREVVQRGPPKGQLQLPGGPQRVGRALGTGQEGVCCTNFRVACMPQMVGCATECNFMRKTATCAFRIQWGANHRFVNKPEACLQAHQMVAGQCPWCATQCPLAESKCTAAR